MSLAIDLSGIDPKLQLADLDRADAEETLYVFYKEAWRYIDPAPWVDSWAIEAIAEHLQAVCDGEIRRLLINISPRCSKSNLVSVAFPAWVWAQTNIGPISGPGVPFLHASYANQLSLRDSVKCRRLIESPWYQARWGNKFQLTSDQNTKSRFTNDKGGERLITSVDGTNTGEGGMCIIIDDGNAAGDMASEATIQTTLDWWTQTMPTRLNNQETGAYINIQQRLAENDLTGHILETEGDDWVHLMIPMRYEPERSYFTKIGWKDPRTEPGQLMWPERFSEEAVTRLERRLGPFQSAGQLQQRPEPKGGGIIKSDWWLLWDRDSYPPMDFIIATLDTAYTTKQQNDPSAIIIWGIFSGDTKAQANRIIDSEGRPIYMDRTYNEGAPKVMMMSSWTARLELHELVAKVAESCTKPKGIPVDILLIEGKASGLSVAQEIRRLYANEKFSVQLFDPKSQDKMARLYSVQHLFAEGLVYAPDRKWAQAVITQCGQFPAGKHDDLVDCVSMGLRTLRDMGVLTRAPERLAELEELKRYRGHQEPLYPV
jgi:predicted phage terminase large subunit-like protein